MKSLSYNLAVKVVLLDHDNVDSLWILESQETETSRATGRSVTHDSTFEHLAKL